MARRTISSSMHRTVLAAGTAALALLALPGTSQSGASGDPLVAVVQAARSDFQLPGLAACVFTSERIVGTVFQGVRCLGADAAIEVDDAFNLASCGKALTATVAAAAVGDGKVAWDTTLGEALADVEMHPAYRGVTLAQLLRHRAGLAPLTDDETPLFEACVRAAPADPSAARRRLAELVLAEPPVSPPGEEVVYSNAGYAIAALVVERATGEPYEAALSSVLFEPLDMRTAFVGWPTSADRPDAPRGHTVAGAERVPDDLDFRDEAPALAPAGGVSMSIEDHARFGMAHLAGLAGRDGVVPADAVREMHTPGEGSQAAMGWFVRELAGEVVHTHDGGTGHFSAAILLLPRHDLGVVVATNVGGGAGAGGEACYRVCVDVLRLALRRAQAGGR